MCYPYLSGRREGHAEAISSAVDSLERVAPARAYNYDRRKGVQEKKTNPTSAFVWQCKVGS